MKRLLLISILTVCMNSVFAQDFWKPLSGPYGAGAYDMIVHPASGAIVLTGAGGVWRSTDQGQSWTKLNLGTVSTFYDLDIDVDGNLYGASTEFPSRIHKSENGGANWTALASTGLPNEFGARIRAVNSSRIYVAINDGSFYRSINGGTSFSLAATFADNIRDIDVSPLNQDHVYLCTTNGGVKVSSNGGFNFSSFPVSGSTSSTDLAHSMVFTPAGIPYVVTSSGIHTKTETGASNAWTSVSGGTASDGFYYGDLTLDAANGKLYYISTGIPRLWTAALADVAGTWTSSNLPSYLNANAFCILSASKWMASTGNSGPFITTDSGASWSEATGDMKGMIIRKIFVTPQNRYFALYGGPGYYQSVDGGETWTIEATSPANRYIEEFLQADDGSVLATSYGGTIRSSGTVGNTWTQQSATSIMGAATSPVGNIMWAPGDNALLSSTDLGVTWPSTAITGLNGAIQKILVDTKNTVWIRTEFNSLYKVDYGTTNAVLLGPNCQDFSIYSPAYDAAVNTVVAVLSSNSRNIAYSTNGGASFTNRLLPSNMASSKIYALRSGAIVTHNRTNNTYISTDAGVTWTTKTLPEANVSINDITVFGNNQLLVSTTGGQNYITPETIIPPLAPSDAGVGTFSSTRGTFYWTDNADNEDTYEVEMSVGNNTEYEFLFEFNGGSNFQNRFYGTAALQPGAVNYFRIRAVNGAGKSAPIEVSINAPEKCTTLSTIPDNRSWTLTVTPDPGYITDQTGPFVETASLITMIGNSIYSYDYDLWIAPQDVEPARPQYSPYLVFTDECGSISAADVSGSLYTDYGNGNGSWDPVTKTFTLKWQAGPGYAPFAATSTYVLNDTDPIPGTSQIKAYVYSPTETLISWNSVGFEKFARVYRSTTPGGPYTNVGEVPYLKTSLIDKNLTTGTTYYYRVTFVNDSGEGNMSAEVSVKPDATLFRPVENSMQLNFENQQGISWGDFDGDGDEDIASPSFQNDLLQAVPPFFYENKGGGAFDRRDLAAVATEINDITRGVAVLDFNNDGKLDMYLAKNTRNDPEYLLINNGNWDFTRQQVPEAGDFETTFRGMGLVDFDRDGYVDILVASDDGGSNPPSYAPILLRNNNGTGFVPVPNAGLSDLAINSKGMAFFDYDNDGDTDLFATNYSTSQELTNVLFKNNGDGTFTKVTGLIFDAETTKAPRSVSVGDIDNDGDMDLYVGYQSDQPDALYRNNGNGTFTNLGGNVAENTNTYGSAFGDIDNDGDLDLIVVNNGTGAGNSIFLNDGNGSYTKYASNELVLHPDYFDIGGAFADYDKDGFIDFMSGKGSTSAINLPNQLFRNATQPSASRRWLEVKLVGTVSNRAAIGARIKVVTPGRTVIREVIGLTGYGSQSSLVQHFGLGSAANVTSIEVRWPNGKVQAFPGVATNQIITLTEDATAPALTFTPANNATSVKTKTKLTIQANETSSAVAGKFISIFAAADLVTPVAKIEATEADHQGNSFIFTLPGDLLINTVYKVSIDAGAFVDDHANFTTAVPTSAWSFTTSEGPKVTALLPVTSAADILNTTTFEITFNVPVTPAAGKKLTVKNGDTELFSVDVSQAGTTADTKYTLPSQEELPYESEVDVIVDAGAFTDVDGNPFKGIALGEWKFTIAAQVDNEPPTVTIDASKIAVLEKNFADVTGVTITATDNIHVASVTFHYRKISSGDWEVVAAANDPEGSNSYKFTVTKAFADAMGFEYYITALDDQGNEGRHPAGTGTLTSRIKLMEGANVPTLTFPTAGTQQSWTIVSVPYDIPVTQIQQLLTGQGESSKSTWRLLQYNKKADGGDEWLAYPAVVNFERGKGYFINSKLPADKATVTFSNVTAPNYSKASLFKMNFKKGWNQIGNPYLVNLNWDQIITYNNAAATLGKLNLYANGQYVQDAQLVAGAGGFVFAQNDLPNVEFSFPGQTTPGRMEELAFGDLGTDNWKVDFVLSQGEMTSRAGGIGMHERALDVFDQLDGFNPPRFFDYLETNFSHPEHFYRYFSKDIIHPKSEHVWEFDVDSNLPGSATLSWDNSAFGNSTRELYLYDVQKQLPVNMYENNSYSFDPSKGNRFRVYYGENAFAKIKAERIVLGDAFPNPTSTVATIPFSLPDKNGIFAVRLEVFDILGRKVRTLLQGHLAPGFYKADWHTTDSINPGEDINPDGIYIYRLTVEAGSNSEVFSGKVMLKK